MLQNHVGNGGCFKLSKALLDKKAVINVDCQKQCFKYAILSILHYDEIDDHRHRTSKYKQWIDELKFGDIDIDKMKFKDIEKFEKLNKIKVVVHLWERGLKGVRYNNRSSVFDKVVNLLLVYSDHEPQWHYCGIKSFV